MATLLHRPVSAGYSVTPKDGVLAVELDGGAGRYRADVLNGARRVTVTWVCNGPQYDYLCAFKRTATANGALPFDISLRLDAEPRQVFAAHFIPDTFRIVRMEGRIRVVEAELEVIKPYDAGEAAADEAIIDAYEAAHGMPP
jgi:hypothetical protein